MKSNLILAQNGAVYTDYESILASVNWCTPSFYGFGLCVDASANKGIVTLSLVLKTPFGNYTKSFTIDSNVCFNWELPIKFGPSVEICIKNFNTNPNVSFELSLKLCIKLPIIGKKCVGWSHVFNLKSFSEEMLSEESISAEDLAALYIMLASSTTEDSHNCQCG